MRHALLLVGLGLVAGAVLHRPLGAQVRDTIPKKRDTTLVIPARPGADSTLRDSIAKHDSLAKVDSLKNIKRDTVKAPLAHSELPNDLDIGRRLHWNRDSLFSTGAITLADLLERVQGMTTLRAGWIAAPAVGAYLGDVHRIRVFYDGAEIPSLDPRSRGALDLTQINLWSIEDAVIEQAPEEVRVYLRSWRVRNTTPVTRTDISTGDQQTNLYRGYYGQRFDNGTALQFGAQQYGTTPPSIFGTSSDQLGLIGRVGWAKKNWSIDGYVTRISRHRGDIFGDLGVDTIPKVESSQSNAYVRAGYGDPDTSGVWAQVMSVASNYKYTGVRTAPSFGLQILESVLAGASLDSSVYQTQHIASAGTTRGPLRLSATERVFVAGGHSISVPSVRGSFATDRLSVSAFFEGKSADSIARADVTAQLTPLSFITFLAGGGRVTDSRITDSSFTANYVRAQAGVRLHNLWLLGGIVRRDSIRLSAPVEFDTLFTARQEPKATGVTAGVRGQLWRLINLDLSGVRWDDSLGFYRPRYQTRSELFVKTSLLDKFPSGDLGIMASAVHEYRSSVRFPIGKTGVVSVPGYRTISTLLEIRILSATISWQFRNVLGERYSQIPFFVNPRQTNYYGVRWEFLN
ncbi:MAG: hypothetical protein ABJF01_13165 [bacterium]